MTALTEPVILLTGRPAAERAADARAGWLVCLVFLKVAFWNNDRIVGNRIMASIITQALNRARRLTGPNGLPTSRAYGFRMPPEE
jgi:hypothetical protein